MSNDTHHNEDNKPGSALTSSIWFVLLLVFLFVSAVNFVNVMSEDEGHGGGHEAATVEHHDADHDNAHGHDADHGHDEAHH